jgi:hypothetical protein
VRYEPRRSPDRAQVDEEPRHDRCIQSGAHGGPGEVQHLEQDILVDLYAEHRRCGEHLRYLIPERVHSAPHDLSQVGRDVLGTVRTARRTCLDPMGDELRCIQRVARGLFSEPRHGVLALRTRARWSHVGGKAGQLVILHAA